MCIVVSGIEHDATRALIGEEVWRSCDVRWIDEARLFEHVESGGSSVSMAVWLYRSPICAVLGVMDANDVGVDEVLGHWLSVNRTILECSRASRFRLRFINVDSLTPGLFPFNIFDGCVEGEGRDESALKLSDARRIADPWNYMLGIFDPRYLEVYSALEELSWVVGPGASGPSLSSETAGPFNVPDGRAGVRSDVELRAVLMALEALSARNDKELSDMRVEIGTLQDENELLLLQLLLSQKELRECRRSQALG